MRQVIQARAAELGQTPEQVRSGDLRSQTYVINQPVLFTWWKAGYEGKPTVEMILRRDDGGFDWLHETGRAPIPPAPDGRAYDWSRAFIYYQSIVVPSSNRALRLSTTTLTPWHSN